MNDLNCNRTNKKNVFNKLLNLFEKRSTLILFIVAVFAILVLSFGIISTVVSAQNPSNSRKLVTSVKIEEGDTLWSIARQYITDDYKDMNTFIAEIKESNGLTSDIIHEDCYIIVPYYSSNTLVMNEEQQNTY